VKSGNDYIILEGNPIVVPLKRTRSKTLAKRMMTCLNDGSGFQGSTPDFFIQKKDLKILYGG
jgi:hypothetical protein